MTKTLFLSLSGIGNLIMQLPTILAYKKIYPNHHITLWVAPRGTKAIAQNEPAINEVLEMPIKNNLLGHIKTSYFLKSQNYNQSFILSPGQLIKSASYLFAAGIPQRIGHTYPWAGNPESKLLLTHSLPEKNNLHDLEQNLALLGLLNPSANVTPQPYTIPLSEDSKAKAMRLLHNNHIHLKNPLVALHAGSAPGFSWKRWPLPNFAALAKDIQAKKNAHILIIGGPDEDSQKQTLAGLIKKDVTVIDSDLITLAAIMSQCALTVSNDSGLMHLSSSARTPTLGLFGPTDEKQTGPRGPHVFTLRADGTTPTYNTETNHLNSQTPDPTMQALTVNQVFQSVCNILA